MSKVIGIYVKLYHDHSPKMVMPRDLGYKFQKLYFSPNSVFIFFGKVTKFGQIGSRTKTLQAKTKPGVETPPSACRVNRCLTLRRPEGGGVKMTLPVVFPKYLSHG